MTLTSRASRVVVSEIAVTVVLAIRYKVDDRWCSDSAAEPQAAGDLAAEQKLRQATLTGALFALPKPTIAALPGAAAGAGMSIALARRSRRG